RIVPGIRYEHIRNLSHDKKDLNKNDIRLTEVLLSPGVGLSYLGVENWTLFTGAYKGFSPTGPGQSGDIKPEESNNYELGASYGAENLNSTFVLFYNDYENIKGICSLSVGCDPSDLDKESNGGKAKIYGTEFNISGQTHFNSYTLQSDFNHSYTYAGFLSDINSSNAEWGVGDIKSGDPLPYVPDQKSALGLGIKDKLWGVRTRFNHTGRRYDQSLKEERRKLGQYITIDLAGDYTVYNSVNLFAKIENLTNKEYVSSMRPFGLRPGKPRSFFVGTKVEF
ncbi:MAG: TonB-dependent receptor, partial [Oligoflexales bacterium]|nr:TonB-dependent receptor [Oligoflexales bacterium]